MDLETGTLSPPAAGASAGHPVPWSVRDTWLGVGLMLVVFALAVVGIFFLPQEEYAQNAAMVLIEVIYLIPVALIFGWRRIHWKRLGFTRFEGRTLGLGCGLLVSAYAVILIHNALLTLLGVNTQGEMIAELLQSLDSPGWLLFSGVIAAPLVEETFFRGFLFPGFRQKYGWVKALLLSSGIFAVAHLDPAALIPTFLLGCLMAYMYQRSNSLWPGIILHFLINAFGLCATLALIKLTEAFS